MDKNDDAQQEAEDLFEKSQQLYLEALIEQELVTMCRATGLGDGALIKDCLAALGVDVGAGFSGGARAGTAALIMDMTGRGAP